MEPGGTLWKDKDDAEDCWQKHDRTSDASRSPFGKYRAHRGENYSGDTL